MYLKVLMKIYMFYGLIISNCWVYHSSLRRNLHCGPLVVFGSFRQHFCVAKDRQYGSIVEIWLQTKSGSLVCP